MKNLLFVCLGNICRSPTAESIMNFLIEKHHLTNEISCDSCGTGLWHVGEAPDPRSRLHGERRGYQFHTVARQFNPYEDFDKYDLILVMDKQNYRDVIAHAIDEASKNKVQLICHYSTKLVYSEVPDPYESGDKGFELVLDILEDACAGVLAHVAGK